MNENNKSIFLGDTETDQYSPTGDVTVGYPQMWIRTNRTEHRTEIQPLIDLANETANQYPEGDSRRAKAVMDVLKSNFGSGSFGHAWIVIFNSEKEGDVTTYGYHNNYGYIKNGTASDTNDNPKRKFHMGYAVKIDDYEKTCNYLENIIIPLLNSYSSVLGHVIDENTPIDPAKGAYTPITNCSWFAGNVWALSVGAPFNQKYTFTQKFDGAAHADDWCMSYLSAVTEIADPGMIAETIAATQD